jgi:hypothetical protein
MPFCESRLAPRTDSTPWLRGWGGGWFSQRMTSLGFAPTSTSTTPTWENSTVCLDVQAPWASLLLSGAKTVETRTYALPPTYQDRWLALLETSPAAEGPLGGVLIGWVQFGEPVRYTNREAWAADASSHLVDPATALPPPAGFGWADDGSTEKWGWPVIERRRARYVVAPPPMMRRELRSLFRLEWPSSGERVVLAASWGRAVAQAAAAKMMATPLATTGSTAGPGPATSAQCLLVMADFDRTLTQFAAPRPAESRSENGAGEECHDVLFYHAQLGSAYEAAVAPLVASAEADKSAAEPAELVRSRAYAGALCTMPALCCHRVSFLAVVQR